MISVLVPFRETGDGSRTRLWDVVRARLEDELPEAEIVVGTDDGMDPFCKAAAVNDAARRSSGDVLYILDADCIVPAAQVRLGATETEHWVKPWTRKLRVTEAQTEKILADGWDGQGRGLETEHVNAYWAAPPLMLPREMFYDVGGMDERYRGWGGEDNAFARSLWKTGHGLAVTVPGVCVHLWHPRIGSHGRDLWPGQAELFSNRPLDKEYERARTPEQMRAVIEGRDRGAVRLAR